MRRKNTRRFDPRYYMDEKTEVLNENETLAGARLPVVRLVTSQTGLAGVAKNGSNVIITQGWPGSPGLQIRVLPKSIGMYKDLDAALSDAVTGERYYASEEEILATTIEEEMPTGQTPHARPGEMVRDLTQRITE